MTGEPEQKSELARIRDNQRRSRARRKEYLSELEAKLRQYDSKGVEVSAQVQRAARAVVTENKKLRELLVQHGVTEDRVESYLRSTKTIDEVNPGQYASNTVQRVEQTLLQGSPNPADSSAGSASAISADRKGSMGPSNLSPASLLGPRQLQASVHQTLTPRLTRSPSCNPADFDSHQSKPDPQDLRHLMMPSRNYNATPDPLWNVDRRLLGTPMHDSFNFPGDSSSNRITLEQTQLPEGHTTTQHLDNDPALDTTFHDDTPTLTEEDHTFSDLDLPFLPEVVHDSGNNSGAESMEMYDSPLFWT